MRISDSDSAAQVQRTQAKALTDGDNRQTGGAVSQPTNVSKIKEVSDNDGVIVDVAPAKIKGAAELRAKMQSDDAPPPVRNLMDAAQLFLKGEDKTPPAKADIEA